MGECAVDPEDDGGGSLWWLGVLMSIVASIASNLGVNVQKYSLMKEEKRSSKKRSYVAQPFWVLGLFLVIVGSIGDFAALGFAAQSLITPVGGFTMVANVFFAHFWLKEALNRKDLVGTAAVIVGVVLIAVFADKSESCFSLEELMSLYTEISFVIYAAVVISMSIFLYVFVKYIERTHKRYGPRSPKYQRWHGLHSFIYPTLSGALGAQSVLFAKSTAELVKAGFRGEDAFQKPMTYVIMLCMFATIFMQLHWLAVALTWFDAVYCIPVFQCFFITVTIFGGALYFQELNKFGLTQMIMFPIGVLVTLTGIVLLSQRDMSRSKLEPLARFRVGGHALRFIIRTRRAVGKRLGHVVVPLHVVLKGAHSPRSTTTSRPSNASTASGSRIVASHALADHTMPRVHSDPAMNKSSKIVLPPLDLKAKPSGSKVAPMVSPATHERLSRHRQRTMSDLGPGFQRTRSARHRARNIEEYPLTPPGNISRMRSMSQMRRMLPVGSEPEALTDDTTPLPVGVALAEGLGSMFRYFVPRSKRFMPSFRRRHSAMGLQRSASIDSSALGDVEMANRPALSALPTHLATIDGSVADSLDQSARTMHSSNSLLPPLRSTNGAGVGMGAGAGAGAGVGAGAAVSPPRHSGGGGGRSGGGGSSTSPYEHVGDTGAYSPLVAGGNTGGHHFNSDTKDGGGDDNAAAARGLVMDGGDSAGDGAAVSEPVAAQAAQQHLPYTHSGTAMVPNIVRTRSTTSNNT